MPDPKESPAQAGDDPRGSPGPPVVESATLFQGTSEIVIRHAGRQYRLRKTRLDKLILTA